MHYYSTCCIVSHTAIKLSPTCSYFLNIPVICLSQWFGYGRILVQKKQQCLQELAEVRPDNNLLYILYSIMYIIITLSGIVAHFAG